MSLIRFSIIISLYIIIIVILIKKDVGIDLASTRSYIISYAAILLRLLIMLS